jgi:hypothetical protein
MGYTIKIGNSVPCKYMNEFSEMVCSFSVERKTLDNAPIFPGCSYVGLSNSRSPSYTDWDGFIKKTHTTSILGKFTEKHPSCVPLTREDVDAVFNALQLYKNTTKLPPGWSADEKTYDYDLARLIWFEFWVRWAVENCQNPAIENY